MDLPKWIFNHDLSPSNPWKHRPFTLRVPSETPVQLRGYHVVMELDKEVENLAPAAIRKGSYMTMPMLVFLQKTYKFAMPDPKKKKAVVREDHSKRKIMPGQQFSFLSPSVS